jgi:hypothetical protein
MCFPAVRPPFVQSARTLDVDVCTLVPRHLSSWACQCQRDGMGRVKVLSERAVDCLVCLRTESAIR